MAYQKQTGHCLKEKFLTAIIITTLLLLMSVTAQGITTRNIRLPAAVPNIQQSDLLLDCKPSTSNQVKWYFLQPGMTTDEEVPYVDYTEYQNSGNGMLRINGVRPRNEGLYFCRYDGGMMNGIMAGTQQFDITVLGAPSFVDCSNDCQPGPLMIVTEGNSFEINASLIFNFAGPRGENQDITLVRVEHFTTLIFFCPNGETFCNTTTNYTERITYTGQRSPWNNISVTVNNSVLSDNGTYRVLLRVLNPNGDIATTMTSSAIVSVTKGSIFATPTISSSPTTTIISTITTSSPVLSAVSSFSSTSSVLMTSIISITPSPPQPSVTDVVGVPNHLQTLTIVIPVVIVVSVLLVIFAIGVGVVLLVTMNRGSSVNTTPATKSTYTCSAEVYQNERTQSFVLSVSENIYHDGSTNLALNGELNSQPVPV